MVPTRIPDSVPSWSFNSCVFYVHISRLVVFQTLALPSELRIPVYGAVAARSLNFQQLHQRVSSVNWEISELMSQHSSYVDFLVQVGSVLGQTGAIGRVRDGMNE